MATVKTTKVQGGADYAMVVNRVHKFKEMYENGQILTEIVTNKDGQVIFKAHAVVDGVIRGTGHAKEDMGSSNINSTSHVECAETSAIGRALAFGIGLMPSGQIASYEEVENAKLQQSHIAVHELTMASAVAYISQALSMAIEEADEEGILEVLTNFKGNVPLKSAVWKELRSDESAYMTERAVKIADEAKTKKEDKLERIVKFATAEAQKNSEV
jgi:hypothetical protein|tara:strand:+ start:2301 stop:2945 length:645 start_codon:yes stop_codon:yes gene_type:complete